MVCMLLVYSITHALQRTFTGDPTGEYNRRAYTPLGEYMETQWERMSPAMFREAIGKLPVCFLPLGTVEWHGEHNTLGLDAVKAHKLCCLTAERVGGVVHPAVYGGMGGLDKPATVVMEGENDWENHLLRPWLEQLCMEFARIGFQAIFILTGHYGHNQQIVVRETAVRMTERLQIPVIGTAEYWLAQDKGYLGDHAGIGETSLALYLFPEITYMDQLKNDPEYQPIVTAPPGATRERGRMYAEAIIDRMARTARNMVGWDDAKLQAYVRAERALVSQQVKGWRKIHPWAAWHRMMATGELTGYGEWLATNRFDRIEQMAAQLLEGVQKSS